MMALLRLLLLFALCTANCWGYDTGHHNDLTRNALQVYGYNENAQRIAGIANFFVDYFAFTPLKEETLPELNRMHFDNIFTLKNASNYWTQFTVNSKSAVETAARNGDALELIMTIGGTLHTVQDFYTHSNWVDSHYRTDCNCYRPDTWIGSVHDANGDYNALLRSQQAIHTYSYGECDENSRNCLAGQLAHGGACVGVNKDSYVRPYWEQSYAFAFSASFEWLENVEQWATAINPNIVNSAKNYVPPTEQDINDLNQLNIYVNTVSYAIKFREEDGHWKGPGSGSLKRFLPAQLEFTKSKSIYKSKYQDDKIHQRWTEPNVYDFANVDSTKQIDVTTITGITQPSNTIQQLTPVVVRTVAVRGQDQTNTPSYYATVTIDGMEFVENVLIDEYDFQPHWTSLKFVNYTGQNVPITYTLKNNKYPGDDPIVSIVPTGADSLSLQFNPVTHALSGDKSGVFDSIDNTFTTKNDNANVDVQLFVTAYKYSNCSTGLPQQYCPNEAYVSNGVFSQCEGETIPEGNSATTLYGYLFIAMLVFIAVC